MTAVRLMQMCGRDNSLEAKCANRRLNRPLLRRRLANELPNRRPGRSRPLLGGLRRRKYAYCCLASPSRMSLRPRPPYLTGVPRNNHLGVAQSPKQLRGASEIVARARAESNDLLRLTSTSEWDARAATGRICAVVASGQIHISTIVYSP